MNKNEEQPKLEEFIQKAIKLTEDQYKLTFKKSSLSLLEEYRIKIAVSKIISKLSSQWFEFLPEVDKTAAFDNILFELAFKTIKFENTANNRNLSKEVISAAAHYLASYRKDQMFLEYDIYDAIDLALEDERTGEI